MKKSILYTFAIAVFLLTGCDDMLDKSPRDQLSNTPVFWNNSNNVESYSNRFYIRQLGLCNRTRYDERLDRQVPRSTSHQLYDTRVSCIYAF